MELITYDQMSLISGGIVTDTQNPNSCKIQNCTSIAKYKCNDCGMLWCETHRKEGYCNLSPNNIHTIIILTGD